MQTPINPIFKYIPSYLPSVDIYSSMLRADNIITNFNFYFSRHSLYKINKTFIGSNSGAIALTIPIVKPKDRESSRIDNLIISNHGNWEHNHWGAIYSSYGKAPFFEHLAPLIQPFYFNRSTDNFLQFCTSLNKVVEDFIMLPSPIHTAPKICNAKFAPYYQLWHQSSDFNSFIPSLSILDIAMHLGPEAYPHLLYFGC